MNTSMTFPKTIDEFIESYQFVDRKEIYTNGSELIPVFRVQQAIEHYLPKWISVKERLPERGRYVLIANNFRDREIGFVDGDGIWWVRLNGICDGDVTHWMPLPEPPEAKG